MWIVWVPLVTGWLTLPYLALVRRNAWLHTPAFALTDPTYAGLRWVAAGVALLCLLLTAWCWARMDANWSMAVSEAQRGELIVDGLFARVRHPIYALSVMLMLCSAMIVATVPMLVDCGHTHRAHAPEGAQRRAAPAEDARRCVRALSADAPGASCRASARVRPDRAGVRRDMGPRRRRLLAAAALAIADIGQHGVPGRCTRCRSSRLPMPRTRIGCWRSIPSGSPRPTCAMSWRARRPRVSSIFRAASRG